MNNSFSLSIAWLAVTTVLLTLPGSALPKESWLDGIWFDKWVHVGLFAMMVWLGGRAIASYPKLMAVFPRHLFRLAVFSVVYGILMELVQHYWIPNRTFDVLDILADTVGAGTGWFFCYRSYIKK